MASRRTCSSSAKAASSFLTDVCTGERIDFEDNYHNFESNDLTPDGRIETWSFQCLLVKALKTAVHDQPTNLALQKDLKRLRTPSTAKEALASSQEREWRLARQGAYVARAKAGL